MLEEINQTIDESGVAQNTQIIWRGDFNISFDLQLDTDGGKPKLKAKSITKILSMMSDHVIFIFIELDFLLHSASFGDKRPLLSSIG